VISMNSASSEDTSVEENSFDRSQSFTETVELLTEKRTSVRVEALKEIIKSLTSECMQEQLSSRLDTLQLYLSSIIRRNSPEEARLACQIVSLIVISLGLDSESFGKGFIPIFVTLIKNTGKPTSIRRYCIHALSTIHFVISSSTEILEDISIFEHIFADHKNDPSLATEAIRAWALMSSTATLHQLSGVLYKNYLPQFVKLLDHKSLEVRSAAGEGIALLESAFLEDDEETQETETKDDPKEKKKKGIHTPDLSYIIEKLQALAKESTKHQAKKDKVKQKSLFREILRTIEDGDLPSEKLTIGKKKLEFEGWPKSFQLNHVRAVLGTGFQLHFQKNDVLGEIFGVNTEEERSNEVRNKKMDRLARQEKEKSNAQLIQKQRKKKTAFLHESDV